MHSHHFTPIHTSQMVPHCVQAAGVRTALLYHFYLPRKSENTCFFLFFFNIVPFYPCTFFLSVLSCQVQNKPNFASSLCEAAWGQHGSGGGINQGGEKRLPCQSATAWWSTRCQPCLHITASSAAKVELTLRPSLAQSDALASHHAKAVTYSRNSFSHLLPPSLRGHTRTCAAFMHAWADTWHIEYLLSEWEGEIIPGRESFLTALQWLLM